MKFLNYNQLIKIYILRLNDRFRQHFNACKKTRCSLLDNFPVQGKHMNNLHIFDNK